MRVPGAGRRRHRRPADHRARASSFRYVATAPVRSSARSPARTILSPSRNSISDLRRRRGVGDLDQSGESIGGQPRDAIGGGGAVPAGGRRKGLASSAWAKPVTKPDTARKATSRSSPDLPESARACSSAPAGARVGISKLRRVRIDTALSPGPRPGVVLVRGGGATHEMMLAQYEKWFAQAGFACRPAGRRSEWFGGAVPDAFAYHLDGDGGVDEFGGVGVAELGDVDVDSGGRALAGPPVVGGGVGPRAAAAVGGGVGAAG